MKTVALYARVSTKDQSTDMQLTHLRQWASARGLTIAKEYVDHGVSGGTVKRPALERLMKGARLREFDAVAVFRFDRFARSLPHLVMALDEFRSLGVAFLSHQEVVDTSTPIGQLMFNLIGAMAQFERSIIQERVTAGLAAARAKGKKLGRPRAQFDEAHARDLRESGMSIRAIARALGVGREAVRARL